jgi:purine-binding chemotaxis protein CheW
VLSDKSRAIVVTAEDITAGITVDDVLDVTYLHPLAIKPLPTAVRTESQGYLKGTAVYGDTMMTILDLPRLLTQGELVVNEQA